MRLLCVVVLALCGGCKRHAPESANPPVENAPPAVAPSPATGAAPAERATPAPATSPPTAAAKLPDGGTLNGDPRGPRAVEFNRVVDGAVPLVRGCFERATLPAGDFTVVVHYTVEPPGYTGAVSARGTAPQEVQDCARGVVENLKFPEFRGKKVENDLPVTFQKRVETKTVEIWDAAPKP